MKKISAETTSVLSIIMLAVISLFAVGQLIFCLIAAPTVLEWLKNSHVAYYSASTAVAPKMTAFIMNQSFENLFNNTYIRVMSMYVFVLCVPFAYGLLNIYFISKNGQSEKPFRASTAACLRVISISFVAEFLVATVLFVILKIIMRALPFYFMYTMIAVALYSLCMVVFSLTISGLINRMGDLRQEHAKKVKKERYKKAAEAKHEPISVEQDPATEPAAPKKPAVSTDFDDVLDSLK